MFGGTPKVSVGMPVYNGERHMRAAIDSILGQTFTDLELIISDNASTDRTREICQEYKAKDPRVRYYRNARNLGAPANWNTVFRLAKGKYFKWASANDVCDRRFLELCVNVLDEHPDAVLAYPRTRLILGDSGESEDFEDRLNLTHDSPVERFQAFFEQKRLNNVLNGLIRPEVLRRTRLHSAYRASDTVLMAELTLHGKFVEIPETLFFRRMDRASAMILRDREGIIRHYDPEMKSLMLFQHWKRHRGYLSSVIRTPLPLHEKICLYEFLVHRFIEDRGYLARDLREATRLWFGRTASNPGQPGQ